jgi:TRAP transporter TAXI family solute receptor
MLIGGAAAGMTAAVGLAQAQQRERIKSVEFITGSPTGTWFPVAAAIAELANKNYEGQPVSIIPGAGAVSNPVRVGRTQSEFGISYGPFLKLAQQGGNEMYKDAYPGLRALFGGTTNMLHFVVAKDSAIRSAKDLKEKKPRLRVGTGPQGSTELFSLQQLLIVAGVSIKDIESWGGRVELLPTSGRSDGWMNRQLDLTNFFIGPPAADVIEMMRARDANILDIDDDLRDELNKRWGFLKYEIGANTYPGQTAPVKTLGLPFVIFAHDKVDETLVYRMTQSVATNHARMIAAHASYKEWDPKAMHEGLGIELHAGAIKYYKEAGLMR